jgi:hypothetical protein
MRKAKTEDWELESGIGNALKCESSSTENGQIIFHNCDVVGKVGSESKKCVSRKSTKGAEEDKIEEVICEKKRKMLTYRFRSTTKECANDRFVHIGM